MVLRFANYKHSLRFAIAIFLFIAVQTQFFAQNSEGACPIRTNQLDKLLETYRVPNHSNQQDNLGQNSWANSDLVYAEDGSYSQTGVNPYNRSYQLRLNNFDFNIPEASTIDGIRLIMKGHSSGEGTVSDYEIFLLDEEGNAKGTNKANKNFEGHRWPNIDSTDIYEWNYGYSSDLWDTLWTANQINDPNFGVSIQLLNLTPDRVELFLDQVLIQVYYTAPKIQCGDVCIPYYVFEDPEAIDYSWITPPGFTVHPDAGAANNIINLVANAAAAGTYELCVETIYPDYISDPCCIKFEYSDCKKGAIGDLVYEDLNGNGVHDSNEIAISDVNVTLYSGALSPIMNVRTNSIGYYSFQSLNKAEYLVGLDIPSGYGAVPQANLDGPYIDNATDPILLDYGQLRNDIDFGLYKYSTITGTTWKDNDGDGIRDQTDDFISTEVSLFDGQNALLATSFSDTSGVYSFNDLPPGTYYLSFERPDSSYKETLLNIGNNDSIDSDISDINGLFRTDDITVLSGNLIRNVDAGFVAKTGSVAGSIWVDGNGDGFNLNEINVSGIDLMLFDCDDNLISSTTSDQNGNYEFLDLSASVEYYIQMGIPDHYGIVGPLNENSFNLIGRTECLSIIPTDTIVVHGAISPFSSVGDFVWSDDNRNGIQDFDEYGLEGVELSLIDSSGLLIAITNSGVSGAYLFDDILPGQYHIELSQFDDQLEVTLNDNINDNNDSDFKLELGVSLTNPFTLNDGVQISNIDCGLVLKASSISGFVWRDKNGDGFIQNSEAGLADNLVSLFDCTGNQIATSSTDSLGIFTFYNLDPLVSYYTHYQLFNGYDYSFDPGDTHVSHANGNGTTDCIAIQAGMDYKLNGGLAPLGFIGDFVWEDSNKNGMQDADENGIPNIEVVMRDVFKNHVSSTTTDVDGYYAFKDVYPAQYSLIINDMYDLYDLTMFNVVSGGTNVSKFFKEDSLSRTYLFNVFDGLNKKNVDAGYIKKFSSISGLVWNDKNGDGFIQTNEDPYSDFQVDLKTCSTGLVAQTGSGTSGIFEFVNVDPLQEYYLEFDLPNGFAYSFAPGDTDITHTNGEGTTDCFYVEPDKNYNKNCGYAPLGTIGDFVWEDLNRNGIQDPDEPGMEGIELVLRDVFKNTVEKTWSNADGYYDFTNVYPAQYSVAIKDMNPQYELTDFNVISNSPIISKFFDEDSIYRTFTFNVFNGINKDNVDAGFKIRQSSILGFVWSDDNGNGTIDMAEQGLSDRTVELYDCASNYLNQTQTNGSGMYSFSDLDVGTEYYIVIDTPEAYSISKAFIDNHITETNGPSSSDCYLLQAGNNLTINAGLAPLSSAGDFIWMDEDRNGIQDPGELGLQNVTVNLYNESGDFIDARTTDEEGYYFLENIYPGSYFFSLSNISAGLAVTQYQAGSDIILDSDFQLLNQTIQTDIIDFNGGIDNMNIDAGLTNSNITINGMVWRDSDGNGQFEISEQNIEGLTVQLFSCEDVLIEQTQTSSDGSYSFFNMDAVNQYYVKILFDDNLFAVSYIGNQNFLTLQNGEAITDCLFGSEFENITLNLGLAPYGSLGDFIWFDINRNGIQEMGEYGLSDILIELYNEEGDLINTSTSDLDGYYRIDKIYPGAYYLLIPELPLNMEISPYQQLFDDDVDSDFNLISGNYRTELFLLLDGRTFLLVDAGIYSTTSSISGVVFEDMDADGQRVSSDPLIDNVLINLLDKQGNVLESTQTDHTGAYLFEDLLPNEYYIQFDLSTEYNISPENIGSENLDSDITGLDFQLATDVLAVANGESIINIDAGVFRNGNIGDYVWLDANKNGIQDVSEQGIEAVDIELYDLNGNLLSNTKSDNTGHYNFNVPPGQYSLFMVVDQQYSFTDLNIGQDGDLDSDFISSNNQFGLVSGIIIESGVDKLAYDAGLQTDEIINEPISISGRIWEDLNGDGLIVNESGTDGVRVVLIDDNGILVSNTESYSDPDFGNGYYIFNDIPSGKYYLEYQIAGAPIATKLFVGADPLLYSSLSETNGPLTTDLIDVISGSITLNAGYFHYVSIGDYVWDDSNSNGIQDNGEQGINDLLIRLYDLNNNLVDLQSTGFHPLNGTMGYYNFDNHDPGSYYIQLNLQQGMFVSTANQGNNPSLDSDINHWNGLNTSQTLVMASGDSNSNIDIGLTQSPGSIGSRLWVDTNGNGVQDNMELGLNGIVVNLYNENQEFVSATITSGDPAEGDGYYRFDQINPGNYYIQFKLPEGYLATLSDKGGDDSKDSDITNLIAPGTTNIFRLDAAETNLDIDGGIYLPASIGDFIWEDANGNGIQDPDESGFESVRVSLSKIGEEFSLTEYTDEFGHYIFEGLRPGEYLLSFETPTGYVFTKLSSGTDILIDSDVDENGTLPSIYINYNEDRSDIDGGLIRADIRVGDRVWLDANQNGLQDYNEEGIQGVDVRLLDDNMDVVQSKTTNILGQYSFVNPSIGDYYVQFVAPQGYEFTTANAGFDFNSDSNADQNGMTEKLSLLAGDYHLDIDAGLRLKGLNVTANDPSKLELLGKHQREYNSLSWRDNDSGSGFMYELFRTVADNDPTLIHQEYVLDNRREYDLRDADFSRGGIYKYVLIKKDEAGLIVDIQELEIFVPYYKFDITRITPNPVLDVCKIELKNKDYSVENLEIIILNDKGQKLMQLSVSPESILNISSLTSGIYTVIIDSGVQKDVHQIIKL